MENTGVKCNVTECVHNVDCTGCNLPTIQVTNETSAMNAVDTPHFCKNFKKK